MKIKGPAFNNWEIQFVYSPFFEMICSLHVLFHPAHHKNREQWAIDMKRRMNTPLYQTLDYFDVISEEYMGAMEYRYLEDCFHEFDVINSIEALLVLPSRQFAYLMMNKKMSEEEIDSYQLKRQQAEGVSNQVHQFLMTTEEAQRSFVAALKEYYYLYFQSDLSVLEPFLVRSIQAHKGLAKTMGMLDYISILHPRIEVLNDRLSLHKYKRFDFLYKDISILDIGISSFMDPHLLMGEEDGMLSLCIRVKVDKIEDAVHEDLIVLLKALADKTRLKIVKLLYEKARCTQELALMIDITEAGISKHLKLLLKAQVIRKIRKGSFMLYYLEPERMDRIPMNIYQYLDE